MLRLIPKAMIDNLYSNWQAPLYKASFGIQKHLDVPLNSHLSLLLPEPVDGRWFVQYKELQGWVADKYIEPYVRNYPQNVVPLQGLETPDPTDAEQYAMVNKIKQVNLCGEFCVCKILGVGLKDFLDLWGIRNVPLWKRIFGAGKARGTGPGELVEMFMLYEKPSLQINQKLYQKWTPRTLYDLMQEYNLIVSVHIDSTNGALRGSGILHWVVPVQNILERQGFGQVEIYNPFSNCYEWYSWREFVASAGAPYGCLVVKE